MESIIASGCFRLGKDAAQAKVMLTSPTSKLYMESMARAVNVRGPKDTDPKEKPKGKPEEKKAKGGKEKGKDNGKKRAKKPKGKKGKEEANDDGENEESSASDSQSPAGDE